MSAIFTRIHMPPSVEHPYSTSLSQHTSLPPFFRHGQTTPSHSMPSYHPTATPCLHPLYLATHSVINYLSLQFGIRYL